MRFVFDVWGDPTVIVCGDAYGFIGVDKPEYLGGRAEVSFFDYEDAPSGEKQERDEVHVEGSLVKLIPLFREALEQLEALEDGFRVQAAEVVARAIQCSKCGRWYDPTPGHGDGFGNECLGDVVVPVGEK